jgi:hypothetical protein
MSAMGHIISRARVLRKRRRGKKEIEEEVEGALPRV